LAGLLAIGVLAPLAAHLLSRRPPAPREFPTLRFLRASATSARRLHVLHDRGLWALRTLIVLVVAVAAAGPTLVTAAREGAWHPPTVRALVIDPALATGTPGDTGAPTRAGDVTWTYASSTVRESLAAALADLAERPASSHEVIIRWSGSRRDLDVTDLESIPAHVGVRLEVMGRGASTVEPTSAAFSIAASSDDDQARVFVLGTVPWTARTDAPLVTWPGAARRDVLEREATPATRPVAEVFRRMQHDPRLTDAAQRSRRDPRVTGTLDERLDRTRFAPLARGAGGEVLLWGAASESRPLLVLDARPRDPLALWALRVADDAARAVKGWPASDESWSREAMASAQRPPATPEAAALPAGLDTRWWWLGALTLMVVESVVRREGQRDGETSLDGADGHAG
jgi:hypothetical protein